MVWTPCQCQGRVCSGFLISSVGRWVSGVVGLKAVSQHQEWSQPLSSCAIIHARLPQLPWMSTCVQKMKKEGQWTSMQEVLKGQPGKGGRSGNKSPRCKGAGNCNWLGSHFKQQLGKRGQESSVHGSTFSLPLRNTCSNGSRFCEAQSLNNLKTALHKFINWEVEIGKIAVRGQLRQKACKTPSEPMAGHSSMHLPS
jgi:hypothetical protein